MSSNKAIIIGSGVAGLAIAIRLAVRGYVVTVYEKNDGPGGKIAVVEKDGFRFDAGPSLFTQPQNIEELFTLAGKDINAYFSYQPVDIACRYFYENGKRINAYTEPSRFAAEMREQLGEPEENIKNYLTRSANLYEKVGTIFTGHSLHKRRTWLHRRILKALSTTKGAYLFNNLNKYNKGKLSSPEAVQLFNRYATYNGSDPYRAPGMLSLIPHLEQNLGTFYPGGGMISISNALYRLAKDIGVSFKFSNPVRRIIQHEGKVRGVVAGDGNDYADIVVSNSDVYYTWSLLLDDARKAKKILKQERSSSALVFYWGMNKQFEDLHLHNIFFSNNYREEFRELFSKGSVHNDPTVYVNITSKMENDHAPPGKENWFVMVNAPADTGQDWEAIKLRVRQQVIAKLSRILGTDIEPLIISESALDPVAIAERTSSFRGSLYGTSSNSKLAAFFRPANFTSAIAGLYFCGGSVHPGGGIPLCLKSAAIVDGLILRDHKNKH